MNSSAAESFVSIFHLFEAEITMQFVFLNNKKKNLLMKNKLDSCNDFTIYFITFICMLYGLKHASKHIYVLASQGLL